MTIILCNNIIFSSEEQKKYSLARAFKPYPETIITIITNACFLLGQDYIENNNSSPSPQTINTIIWGTTAMYITGLLARIRKYCKTKKQNREETMRRLQKPLLAEDEIENKNQSIPAQEVSPEYFIPYVNNRKTLTEEQAVTSSILVELTRSSEENNLTATATTASLESAFKKKLTHFPEQCQE
jgi:hypothetical protein